MNHPYKISVHFKGGDSQKFGKDLKNSAKFEIQILDIRILENHGQGPGIIHVKVQTPWITLTMEN